MPLPLTVSCFSKIQIGFTFLVPAHPGSPRQRAIKWVSVCISYQFLRLTFHWSSVGLLCCSVDSRLVEHRLFCMCKDAMWLNRPLTWLVLANQKHLRNHPQLFAPKTKKTAKYDIMSYTVQRIWCSSKKQVQRSHRLSLVGHTITQSRLSVQKTTATEFVHCGIQARLVHMNIRCRLSQTCSYIIVYIML